jgi:tRNA(His) guanylyltransferase
MSDGLGDRIKKYEKAFSPAYPIRLPLILRLDGVHFHSNVKKWKCERPFDENLINAMFFTAKTLCENIAGAQIAYVQSDEITILVRDDMDTHSQPWYDKKINKVMSVAAAKASNAFNWKYYSLTAEYADDCDYPYPVRTNPLDLKKMAEFDCRGFIVPEYEINNVLLWRQQDCTRNSVQMLARAHFSHKELHKKNNSEIQDMLMLEKGVNWNDLQTYLKRGACVIKQDVPKKVPKRDDRGKVIDGEFETITRPSWVVDKEIPIFTQDKEYVNQFAYIKE